MVGSAGRRFAEAAGKCRQSPMRPASAVTSPKRPECLCQPQQEAAGCGTHWRGCRNALPARSKCNSGLLSCAAFPQRGVPAGMAQQMAAAAQDGCALRIKVSRQDG